MKIKLTANEVHERLAKASEALSNALDDMHALHEELNELMDLDEEDIEDEELREMLYEWDVCTHLDDSIGSLESAMDDIPT